MLKRFGLWVVSGALACCLVGAATVHAITPKSAHYQFDESTVGQTGALSSSSPNYQTSGVAGSSVVGKTSSSNYQTQTGPKTSGEPALSLSIINSNTGFGSFNPTSATTATAQFSVVDYTSYGYIVQIVGNPPSYEGHQLAAMPTPGTSNPGTEQFGINLVENTNFCGSGCNVGANPDYGQFGVAAAKPTANYDTPGTFYYSNGDTIVESPKSTGKVVYTITYLINVSSHTPAGGYTSNQQIICTGTY